MHEPPEEKGETPEKKPWMERPLPRLSGCLG